MKSTTTFNSETSVSKLMNLVRAEGNKNFMNLAERLHLPVEVTVKFS